MDRMPLSFPVTIKTAHVQNGKDQIVYYPQAKKMEDEKLQSFINETIVSKTQQLIDLQVAEVPSPIVQMIGSYEMKNNQRDVLSLSLSNYTYYEHAAHGMTYMKSVTFDLQKGTVCTLKDLFKENSDYIKKISDIIKNEMAARGMSPLEQFTSIRPDQDFYIADKTLVIYFQLYELMAYVFGFPMFPISVYALEDIILEDGPLGRMIAN